MQCLNYFAIELLKFLAIFVRENFRLTSFKSVIHLINLFIELFLILGKFIVKRFLNSRNYDLFLSVFLCLNQFNFAFQSQSGTLSFIRLILNAAELQHIFCLNILTDNELKLVTLQQKH